jgi:glycosyltransferase involved in cell wall biosynthesis
MSRILLVCPEPLGHGRPAGVGIRFLEIARVLRGDGHRLTVLSPDAGKVDGCASGGTDAATLHAASEGHDAAVVQGHIANELWAHGRPLPTVVDLYDPYLVENLHYYGERGAEVFQHDHATLMESIVRGDFFLCASEAQRMFYLGLLLAAGRLNPQLFASDPRLESLVAIAPFGVPAPRQPRGRALRGPAVLFGGIYDWYDPIAAIEAVALVRETLPGATLTFTRHPNPAITPQGKLAAAMDHVRAHGYDFVRFEPWAGYDERGVFFETFDLALLTFPRSLETDLSMRTRVFDYLWCGLPVVTSRAPGIDEILVRYGAGSSIAIDAPAAFANEIVAIANDGARYGRMVDGTQAFTLEHQWPVTLAPLREFCLSPRTDVTKERFAQRPQLPSRPATLIDRVRRRLRA